MADYSSRDKQQASLIVDRLLEFESEPRRREFRIEVDLPPGVSVPGNLVLSDVQSCVRQCTADMRIFKELQSIDVPTFRFADEYVPVSLSYLIAQLQRWPTNIYEQPEQLFWVWQQIPYPRTAEMLQTLRNESEVLRVTWMKYEEVEITFRRLTIEFVATRIAGVERLSRLARQGRRAVMLSFPQRRPGRPVKTPGCNFKVTTNSNGLRVFWSGASYVLPSYFSHPTSPVSSTLQAGQYLFGVDGGAYGNAIQWDHNAIISLPGPTTQVHLNY